MTEKIREWWNHCDAMSKAVTAIIFFFGLGAAVGVALLQGNVSANTEALEFITPQVEANTRAIGEQSGKLDRLICYNEEAARQAQGEYPNFARCTR